MKNLFASSTLLFASAALFAAGLLFQSRADEKLVAPTSLSVPVECVLGSGPTIPPIDEDTSGETKVASGPTIPPIDEDTSGETKRA